MPARFVHFFFFFSFLEAARVSHSWVCFFTVLLLRPLEVFLQWLGFGFSESWHMAPSAQVHCQLITTFKKSWGFHSNDVTTTNGKLAVEPLLYHKASLSCLLELLAYFWIFQLLCLCLLANYHPWYPITPSLPSVWPFFVKPTAKWRDTKYLVRIVPRQKWHKVSASLWRTKPGMAFPPPQAARLFRMHASYCHHITRLITEDGYSLSCII